MNSFKKFALKQTYTCFFNSLLREISFYTVVDKKIEIYLPLGDLVLNLKRSSVVGRHEYTGEFFFKNKNNYSSLDFFQALDVLLPNLFKTAEPHQDTLIKIFKERVQNSLHNMELSFAQRQKDIEEFLNEALSFEKAEQSLFVGHNFHPYPKMREGFSDEDYKVYSPEMAGSFKLLWVGILSENLEQFKAQNFQDEQWTKTLAVFDGVKAPAHLTPVPMHPWQYHTLIKSKRLMDYPLEVLGEGQKNWYPTSSLRSLYSPGAPYMLKYSLTLKLTNSVRHLTDVEVVRGMQVYDMLRSQKGLEFTDKHPEFQIIAEPAFLGLKDSAGKLMNDTLVVARINPFAERAKDHIVVSTLAQDHPYGKENLLAAHVRKYGQQQKLSLQQASLAWFHAYLTVAVRPLVQAQANFGFLLGAHQQNLILKIENHLPVKGYFRDCQGTGYNQIGFQFYKSEVPSMTLENGNILGEMGNILFAYYLIINSTFNVLSALAQNESVTEEELLGELRELLQSIREENPLDKSFLDYVLDRKEILQKGNFFCSLDNINENTTENPLAFYNLIPNPLYAGAKNAKPNPKI